MATANSAPTPVYSTVSTGYRDPSNIMGDITRLKDRVYQDLYTPVERDLLNRVNSTELIDTAKRDLDRDQTDRAAQQQRQLSRYNLAPGAAAAQENAQRSADQTVLSRANTMNNARINQRDTNRSLLSSLISVGRGIENDASSQFSALSDAAAQREMANDQAQSAKRQSNQTTAASIASALIIAFA